MKVKLGLTACNHLCPQCPLTPAAGGCQGGASCSCSGPSHPGLLLCPHFSGHPLSPSRPAQVTSSPPEP